MGLWEWGGAISPAVAAAAARGAWGRARRDRGLPEAEGNANRDGEVVGCGCGVRLGAAFLPLFAVGVVRCLPREACVCVWGVRSCRACSLSRGSRRCRSVLIIGVGPVFARGTRWAPPSDSWHGEPPLRARGAGTWNITNLII